MGLTSEIGQFLSTIGRAEVPAEAMPVVRAGFTDCVAVMVAGRREAVSRIVADSVGAKFPDDGIMLNGVAAPEAALAYGTAAHALDYDDVALSGHPSAVLVPAILAEAAETGADGRTMANAYVAGYEVWAELIRRDADQIHLKGWHPSAVIGTLAAASASAVVRKLDAERAAHAIGIAASMAAGIAANFGSMTKPYQVGRAAQSGLTATRLAEAGLTSASDALEHNLGFLRAISPKQNVDTQSPAALGREWCILETGINIKLYPMCYGTHRVLDAMLGLVKSERIAADDITGVEVEVGETQAAILRNHRPQLALDAKFSAEFAMAAAAIAKRCGMSELDDRFVQRADVQAFMPKVSVTAKPGRSADDAAMGMADRVRVTLRDNRQLASPPVSHPLGHFKNPVGAEVLWGKFADCVNGAPIEARPLFDRLQRIDKLTSVADIGR
jgi:2-methylcitrate dehydratase PrpD